MYFLLTLLITGLALQVAYLVLFLFAFYRRRVHHIPDRLPGVSLIVAAHDEEENLRELIPLLMEQNHPDFEVIVVEDRCNDGTYDFLLEATRQYKGLKMVRVVFKPDHIHGKKYALTLGIKAARHEWILLTDADCRPATREWMSCMGSYMSDQTQIVIGCSPYLPQPGWLNAFIRFESFLTTIQFAGFALLGRPYMGVGRNLAYRKSLFLDNKGFNGHLEVTGGDDDLFVNRHARSSNTQVCLEPDSRVMSKPKTTWSTFWYQKKRHLSAGKYYRLADKLLLGLFSLSWIVADLLLLPVGAVQNEWRYVLTFMFLLRWSLLIVLFHQVSRRLGDAFESWKVPFLEFLYAFYYLVAGFIALLSQKVRWKK